MHTNQETTMTTIEINDIDETTASAAAPVARCGDGHGTLTPLFFSDDLVDIARAKAICSRCALSTSCLQGALDRAEPWGVWGGELLENGVIVVNKRPRGRPAVLPRPTLVIDEDRTIRSIANLDDKTEYEVVIRVA